MIFFFFSSRRRHTRLQGDWSSDVCSSDLQMFAAGELVAGLSSRAVNGRLTSEQALRELLAGTSLEATRTHNGGFAIRRPAASGATDRKSTRLNSSHLVISYAVFCLKKKKIEMSYTTLIHTL